MVRSIFPAVICAGVLLAGCRTAPRSEVQRVAEHRERIFWHKQAQNVRVGLGVSQQPGRDTVTLACLVHNDSYRPLKLAAPPAFYVDGKPLPVATSNESAMEAGTPATVPANGSTRFTVTHDFAPGRAYRVFAGTQLAVSDAPTAPHLVTPEVSLSVLVGFPSALSWERSASPGP